MTQARKRTTHTEQEPRRLPPWITVVHPAPTDYTFGFDDEATFEPYGSGSAAFMSAEEGEVP